MELSIGQEVILTSRQGGILAGTVERFENGGRVAIIMPGDPAMKTWYPNGYHLGCAHWDSRLTLVER